MYLKIADAVKIFNDPLTCNDLEGEAEVIDIIAVDDVFVWVTVKFDDTADVTFTKEENIFMRQINIEHFKKHLVEN